ncbi:unnamed protein product [Linum tenue]|uniref:Uncharacterized protein n=1 Tax=Linum tenue TaxID=586396 RepID=A0AAV0H7T9_9ROSI|nr:unnamed protein product [Linum tenue]
MAVTLPSAATARPISGSVTFRRPPSCFLPPKQLPFLPIPASKNTIHRHRLISTATLDEKDPIGVAEEEEEEQGFSQEIDKEVEEKVRLLKDAAKTRKVTAAEILEAFAVIEKAKIDPSGFLHTLGGTQSPGRTWMLVFTAQKKLKGGRYFPITAVQRFDAAGKRIENGVYFGPIGWLTFEGRFAWKKKKILAFIFERIRIKLGPFNPLEIGIGSGGEQGDKEPTTKNDPFFIWLYIDQELAVGRGRSGGTAFWCRCRRVVTNDI